MLASQFFAQNGAMEVDEAEKSKWCMYILGATLPRWNSSSMQCFCYESISCSCSAKPPKTEQSYAEGMNAGMLMLDLCMASCLYRILGDNRIGTVRNSINPASRDGSCIYMTRCLYRILRDNRIVEYSKELHQYRICATVNTLGAAVHCTTWSHKLVHWRSTGGQAQ